MRLLLALLVFGGAAACDDEPADPRYASPQATLDTLMRSYGVLDLSQEEIQAHMRSRGHFEVRDDVSFQNCFDDYRGPRDEGLVGFVFGTLAAGKDQLRVVEAQGRAHVYPNPDRRDRSIVLVDRDGEWKISLRSSVPSDVQEALTSEYQRISERARALGAPE